MTNFKFDYPQPGITNFFTPLLVAARFASSGGRCWYAAWALCLAYQQPDEGIIIGIQPGVSVKNFGEVYTINFKLRREFSFL